MNQIKRFLVCMLARNGDFMRSFVCSLSFLLIFWFIPPTASLAECLNSSSISILDKKSDIGELPSVGYMVNSPLILEFNFGKIDSEDNYKIIWKATNGKIYGEGHRVNFIPDKLGLSEIEALIIDGSTICTSKRVELEIVNEAVEITTNELVKFKPHNKRNFHAEITGRVLNLPPGNWKLAAYKHSDIFYKFEHNEFYIDSEGNFALFLELSEDLDRIVLMLVDQSVDPNNFGYCMTSRNAKVVKGQCAGLHDREYFSKNKIPFSLANDGVLTYKTILLRPNNEHSDPQIEHIINAYAKIPVNLQKKDSHTSHTLGEAHLVTSYPESDQYYLYDQALAAMALTHAGEFSKAEEIFDAVLSLQLADGSWFFSYEAYGGTDYSIHGDDRRPSGAIAWMLMAANYYVKETGDSKYLPMIQKTVNYLRSNLVSFYIEGQEVKALRFGPSDREQTSWPETEVFSLEHNLDLYSALLSYAEISGDERALKDASAVKQFIIELWNETDYHFYPGYQLGKVNDFNKGDIYLDTQSWAVLSVGFPEELPNIKKGLEFNCRNFIETAGFISSKRSGIFGFYDHYVEDNNSSENNFVWSEGTLGMIKALMLAELDDGKEIVCNRYGRDFTWRSLLDEMNEMSLADGGLYYATFTRNLDFAYNTSIAGTAWLYFANNGFNPFSLRQIDSFAYKPPRSSVIEVTGPVKYQGPSDLNNFSELLVDNFDSGLTTGFVETRENVIGQFHSTYSQAPSKIQFEKVEQILSGFDNGASAGKSLKLTYNREKSGWAGWYTVIGGKDVSKYNVLTFWVKSLSPEAEKINFSFLLQDLKMNQNGYEPFNMGALDSMLPQEAESIHEWTKLEIPLYRSAGAVDLSELYSISLSFDFEGKGSIFLDDVKFEYNPNIFHMVYQHDEIKNPNLGQITGPKEKGFNGFAGDKSVSKPPIGELNFNKQFVFDSNANLKLSKVSELPHISNSKLMDFDGKLTQPLKKFNRGYVGTFQRGQSKSSISFNNKPRHYFSEDDVISNVSTLDFDFTEKGSYRSEYQVQDTGVGNFSGNYFIVDADLSEYSTLTFLVKGSKGGESFRIGATDLHSNAQEKSIFAGSIEGFLDNGITTDWQVVTIPLKLFSGLDKSSFFSLVFDHQNEGSGVYWIDEIRFTKKSSYRKNSEEFFLVDSFDSTDVNSIGRRTGKFSRSPAFGKVVRILDEILNSRVAEISYDNTGEEDGYVGIYSMLNSFNAEFGSFGDIQDVSKYNYLSFKVRGKLGGESFKIGLADLSYQEQDDAFIVGSIEDFVRDGLDVNWTTVYVPLKGLSMLDLTKMGAVSFLFDTKSSGTIYLDNIGFTSSAVN